MTIPALAALQSMQALVTSQTPQMRGAWQPSTWMQLQLSPVQRL